MTKESPATELREQEPVAWEGKTKLGFPIGAHRIIFADKVRAEEWLSGFVEGHAWLEPLAYISPPAQRTWVELTDEEIEKFWNSGVRAFFLLARAIEAKLKEKNT